MLLLLACTAPKDTDPPRDDSERESSPPESDAPDDTSETSDSPDSDLHPVGEPLVIVVMADDLGDNMYWAMEETAARLDPVGRRFTRAYTTIPNCCPTRASFFSNAFPAETGIEGNTELTGGFSNFVDTTTIATRLQDEGVRTAIIGKYLNGYETDTRLYVPPGWDRFAVPTYLGDYTDSTIFEGTSTPIAAGTAEPTDTEGEFLTDWVFDQALTFLDEHPDEPTFLLVTPQSPHAEATPAAEDLGTWAGYEWRPTSFAEEDASDKPGFIRSYTVTDDDIARWDARTVLMMENQASLDRAVAAFYDALDSRGLLDRATLIFTSDNGMLHGEHRTEDKALPYEEAVRVPLVVVQRGLSAGEDSRLVAINLDIPALALDLLDAPSLPTDQGQSLQALLDDDAAAGRNRIFLESAVPGHPPWAGVVTDRWKYVELSTGETELYDLDADPEELESLHAAPPADADLEVMRAWVDEHRALVITSTGVETCTPGDAYSFTLDTWGEQGTLTWTLDDGSLPEGLSLGTDGVISGTTSETGSWSFTARVTDSVLSPVTGLAHTFAATFTLSCGSGMAAVSREGGTAEFHVPAHRGARVAVSVTTDPTWDTPPRRSAITVAGDEPVVLTMELDPRRTWHWRTEIDGVIVPAGVLPGRASP